MFDIRSFLDAYGVYYKIGEGNRGQELKVDCPVCGGRQKLWCSLSKERVFCHRCRWTPVSTENFISLLVKASPFQVDLIYHKFQKRGKTKSLEEIVEEITGNPSLDVSLVDFEEEGKKYKSIFQDFIDEIPKKEQEPLDWPPYYLPLGDERMPTINAYALSRGFSFKEMKKHQFGGCPQGKYYGSLILPAINDGKLMFWQARDVLGRNHDEFPKYRTPFGYSPKGCLFNLDIATSFDEVIICEGIFSAMRTGKDAVATFGNKISIEQIKLLIEKGIKKVVLCFDPDTWTLPKIVLERGLRGFKPPVYVAVGMLTQYFDSVRVVHLIDGDPDDMGYDSMRRMIDSAKKIDNKMDLVSIS